jgi:hypothetical protein
VACGVCSVEHIVYGVECMVYSVWCRVHGVWCPVRGVVKIAASAAAAANFSRCAVTIRVGDGTKTLVLNYTL